jgi:hypothetical protein
MSATSELHGELIGLRRGRGLQRPDLGSCIAPQLRALSGVTPSDQDGQIRRKVHRVLMMLIADLPHDLRRAAELAYALDENHRYTRLSDRTDQLCRELSCQPRTARRRIEEATLAMTQAAESTPAGADSGRRGPGWEIRSLEALLRLDTATPELYETQRIAATRDLNEITILVGLPRPRTEPATERLLVVDALYGVLVRECARQPDNRHYRVVLTLPRMLRADDQHEFCLHYRVGTDQPIWPHYAIVPLSPCDSGTVRIRFSPGRVPAAVWLLDDVPYPLLCDDTPGPDRIEVDAVGDVRLRFRNLREGHGYGAAWAPQDA